MKRKYYILGVLTLLCLLGTGYYAWTLYDAHCKQVAEWNEGAKAAFEEALWVEVNKRAEIPMYYSSSGEYGMTALNERVPDSVSVMTMEGFRKYKIDRDKYENSLIKETMRRSYLSSLLEEYPLSIDTLFVRFDSVLSKKQISVSCRIRYVYTDLNLNNDTVFSVVDKQFSGLDSLTVKYLGFRCEHELAAFVSYSYWTDSLIPTDWCILLSPWILLILLIFYYPQLETLAKRKLTHEKVIEKTIEIEKEIVVEKEIHVTDVQMDTVGFFKFPDGTIFDSFTSSLSKDGVQRRLQPQSVSLLKLFLSKKDHQFTSDEICMKLWGDTRFSYRLHSAITRFRSDLNAVKSELLVTCSYGVYELKLPISSENSEN